MATLLDELSGLITPLNENGRPQDLADIERLENEES